jgi:hypothetical protein
MHAMGPNVAGVVGSAVAAGVMISLVSHRAGATLGIPVSLRYLCALALVELDGHTYMLAA